jgi:hypothetical protein
MPDGGSVFASLNVGDKFSLNGGVDSYYATLKNNVADPNYRARNAGVVVSGRLYGSYAFPKGWGVQVFGFYRGQQVQLQGAQSNFVLYSLSLKHDFAQRKGSLGFGAENFFTPSNTVRNNVTSPLLTQNSTTVQRITSFEVYFSYRIGQLTAEPRAHKNVQNNDLKVDENGGGSQGTGRPPDATRPAPSPPATKPGSQPKANVLLMRVRQRHCQPHLRPPSARPAARLRVSRRRFPSRVLPQLAHQAPHPLVAWRTAISRHRAAQEERKVNARPVRSPARYAAILGDRAGTNPRQTVVKFLVLGCTCTLIA